jgi:hypothetical protein
MVQFTSPAVPSGDCCLVLGFRGGIFRIVIFKTQILRLSLHHVLPHVQRPPDRTFLADPPEAESATDSPQVISCLSPIRRGPGIEHRSSVADACIQTPLLWILAPVTPIPANFKVKKSVSRQSEKIDELSHISCNLCAGNNQQFSKIRYDRLCRTKGTCLVVLVCSEAC